MKNIVKEVKQVIKQVLQPVHCNQSKSKVIHASLLFLDANGMCSFQYYTIFFCSLKQENKGRIFASK
jgi:hypothetical protein